MKGFRLGSIGLGLALALGFHGSAAGADETGPEFDPINHAYAVYLGSGYYNSGGRSVFVLRAAPKFRVRDEEEKAFGIRVRLNATFGFYNTASDDFPGFDVPDRLNSLAFVPGIEFPVRATENWTVMPFLDFGVATNDEFTETTLVHGVGLRSRAEFLDPEHVYVLWNELIAAGNSETDFSSKDDYSVFRIDFEVRGVFDFVLSGRDFDIGFLGKADFYFDPVIVEPPVVGDDFEILRRFEIGVSFGATERWKHFGMLTTPRLALTSRFGNDFSGYGVLLRFRY